MIRMGFHTNGMPPLLDSIPQLKTWSPMSLSSEMLTTDPELDSI